MQRKTAVLGFAACALCASAVLSVACGGGSGAPAASPESGSSAAADAPPAAGDAAASDGAPAADASKDAAPGADAAAKKPSATEQSLLALCEEGCKKIKAHCTDTAYENCKMNCAQYEHPPAGCEGEARKALEQAIGTSDALFRRLQVTEVLPCYKLATRDSVLGAFLDEIQSQSQPGQQILRVCY
jgi:hypothetical protein